MIKVGLPAGFHPVEGVGGGKLPLQSTQLPPQKERREGEERKERETERGRIYMFANSLKTMQYLCHPPKILLAMERNIVREIPTPLPPQTKISG